MLKTSIVLALVAAFCLSADAFQTSPSSSIGRTQSSVFLSRHRSMRYFGGSLLRMSNADSESSSSTATESDDPMAEAMMDEGTRRALEKMKKAEELRAQEVFIKRSTGKHKCTNCDWEYDETKGDKMMIGGMVAEGTVFGDLPSNWRCPVCRASKDSFAEVLEEIPGFEVNQGYGFGTNSWTAGQKNLAIFGGLGIFFVLFLSGYAMS